MVALLEYFRILLIQPIENFLNLLQTILINQILNSHNYLRNKIADREFYFVDEKNFNF